MPPGAYPHLRELTQKTERFVKARGVVGVTGPRKFILKAINVLLDNQIAAFDTVAQAKEWLVTKSLEDL